MRDSGWMNELSPRPTPLKPQISSTMRALYEILFLNHGKGTTLKAAEAWRMAVWRSLEGHEDTKDRHIHYGDLGRIQKRPESARPEFKFDSKTLNVFWDRAVRAWLDGWLQNTMPAELLEGMKPSPEKPFVELSTMKCTEIHCDAHGIYKWTVGRSAPIPLIRPWRSCAPVGRSIKKSVMVQDRSGSNGDSVSWSTLSRIC